MAKIMIDTSVCPTDESRFDKHTDDFLSLVTEAIDIWHFAYFTPVWYVGPGSPSKVCSAIGDKGWMPPPYYVAVKCRVHRLRLQAVRLMTTTPNREGIWDGEVVVGIAEEVVRMEEQGFYDGSAEDDEFPVDSIPENHELVLPPPLPESRRLHDVRVRLPDHARGKVTLSGQRRRDDHSWEFLAREYDPLSGCWTDVPISSPPYLAYFWN